MKKITYIFLFVITSVFSQGKIERDLGEFSKLAVYDGINLEIIKDSENKVKIAGKNTEYVVVKNKNGDLKIRLNLEKRFSGDRTKVTLYYKKLYNVVSHEGSNVFSKDTIKQADISFKANTGSRINIIVQTNTLSTTAVSGSTISVSGNADYHDTSSSTGAEIKAQELKTNETYATATTGGVIDVFAVEDLEVNSKIGGMINVYSKTNKIVERISVGGTVNYLYQD